MSAGQWLDRLDARMLVNDARQRLADAGRRWTALINPAKGDQPRATRLGVARDTVRKALGR